MNLKKDKIIDYGLDILIGLLCITFIVVLLRGNSKEQQDDLSNSSGPLQFTTEDVFDKQELLGLDIITSPVLTNGSGEYWLEVKITNKKNEAFSLKGFSIIVYDENHKQIDTLHYFQNIHVESGDPIRFLVDCDPDLLKENYTLEYRLSYMKRE